MNKTNFTLNLLTAIILATPSLHAFKPKSKFFKSPEEATNYLTTHYNLGCKYYDKESWSKASHEFEKVVFYFPDAEPAAEASFYLAVSYYEMGEFDFANESFSNYLKTSQHPTFFEEAVTYKFLIAEHFKTGKKQHPFRMRYLPKWISGQDSALTIYDEVVAALPNHELSVKALYSKAELLKKMREFRDSVEAYQLLIRRFPRHEIVPACYLGIANAYVRQSRIEFQNPDIIALAELNVRKFKEDFPRDEKVVIAEESVCNIKELFAKGLCDLGLFYERKKLPDAAAIYFQSSIDEFPETRVAQFCRCKLNSLGYLQEDSSNAIQENGDLVQDGACLVTCLPKSDDFPLEEPFIQNDYYQNGSVPIDIQTNEEEDFIHYSLRKERDMKEVANYPDTSFTSQECYPPPTEAPHALENENPEQIEKPLWHYSSIKHREQYVPDQD